jgi:hypothetical protein
MSMRIDCNATPEHGQLPLIKPKLGLINEGLGETLDH